MKTISRWTLAILLLATLKVATGIVGFVQMGLPGDLRAIGATPPPPAVSLLNIVAFAAAAYVLIGGSRGDRRAISLGGCFLLVATSFSNRLIESLGAAAPGIAPSLHLLSGLNIDAFQPCLFWLFVRDFPEAQASPEIRRVITLGIRASTLIALVLFVANSTLTIQEVFGVRLGPLGALAGTLHAQRPTVDLQPGMRLSRTLYYPLLLALGMTALPVALWKARRATDIERRRVGLFLAAICTGSGLIALEILFEELFPAYKQLVKAQPASVVHALVVYLVLLSVPFGTAYAVLVHHVLDVKLVVRQAIQYALARFTVMALTALPFLALVWHLYTHRSQTIAQLVLSGHPILLLLAAMAGLAALSARRTALDTIDRRFFREAYDVRRILSDLVERSRAVATETELAALLSRELDNAFHLRSIALLLRHPFSQWLIAPDGAARSLDGSSTLATLVAGSTEPLDVDLSQPRTPFARLRHEERQWIADGGFQLLVPMLGSDASLVGLIALGEKKSELPFQAEDRMLLSAVAAAGALAVENRLLRASTPGASGEPVVTDRADRASASLADEVATECTRCQRLFPPRTDACPACRNALVPAAVPHVLGGKLRFERRIGAGGMGVVYQAIDLTLRRFVAVKTLPRISPEAASRLRREARAVASISHPNLAQIFGAETWRGTPMLIFEFLDGGTLADRLHRGRVPPGDTVRMALVVAAVLDRAHHAGILHGDIKPSNIGYNAEGSPKLLDFGVARILQSSQTVTSVAALLQQDMSDRTTGFQINPLADLTKGDHPLIGTLAYLSPEALDGEPADPRFDLWSLAIVMYEALAGRNPMAARTSLETVLLIREAEILPVSHWRHDCPASLVTFLERALTRTVSARPATAEEFGRLLTQAAVDVGERTSEAGLS